MANRRDIDRLARSLAGQRLDPLYIQHYLVETFAISMEAAEEVLIRLGIPKKSAIASLKASTDGGTAKKPAARTTEQRKPPGQNFF